MKRFIALFSIFLFLELNATAITVIAQPKTLTQGFYKVNESGLITNSTYKIKNISPSNQSVVMVFDGKEMMQEFLRLEPNSPEYYLRPLAYDYIIIIIGLGEVQFI